MHAATQIFIYWLLAFLSLGIALPLLVFFFAIIGDDLEVLSLKAEACVAGAASLVEAMGFWLIITLISPTYAAVASRALIFPAIVVALIYKAAHFEDWGKVQLFLLLVFQVVIACVGISLFKGQYYMAICIVAGFVVLMAVIAGFIRSLWG